MTSSHIQNNNGIESSTTDAVASIPRTGLRGMKAVVVVSFIAFLFLVAVLHSVVSFNCIAVCRHFIADTWLFSKLEQFYRL